jgi:hypothetical protein
MKGITILRTTTELILFLSENPHKSKKIKKYCDEFLDSILDVKQFNEKKIYCERVNFFRQNGAVRKKNRKVVGLLICTYILLRMHLFPLMLYKTISSERNYERVT